MVDRPVESWRRPDFTGFSGQLLVILNLCGQLECELSRRGIRASSYSESDSFEIDLADRPGTESRDVAPGAGFDFDAEDLLVGIDIDHASRVADQRTLEAEKLPLGALPAG